MKKLLAAGVVVVALGLAPPSAPSAAAQATLRGPDNVCYGQIVAGIAATWPFAHDDRQDFLPPPGAIALWIRLFGEPFGITSVRQLQVQFCDA